tara:strand:+ start:4826 stop:5230 length:405 start_codon:yes stop_codon:yes gene_type:complete
MKKVSFIYSRNKLDFKKYSKITKYDDIISYHDIITKLVKNDDYNDRPSEIVVNTYLRKKILKAMTDEKVGHVIYALKELDVSTINSIIEIMENYNSSDDLSVKLVVIKHKKFSVDIDKDSEINSVFSDIIFSEL